jgi:excisionase family DNA binding protein
VSSSINEPDRLAYSIEQAVFATDISRSLLYREIKAGRLIATKIGNRTLLTRQALEDWLDGGAER